MIDDNKLFSDENNLLDLSLKKMKTFSKIDLYKNVNNEEKNINDE